MKSATVLLIALSVSSYLQANPLDSVRMHTNKGKLFLIHRVEKGEGLYAIARKYNVHVKLVAEANLERSAALKPGEEILVPYVFQDTSAMIYLEDKPQAEIKKKEAVKRNPDRTAQVDETHANADTWGQDRVGIHIVSAGETVQRIALRYKITPNELVKWNGIRDNMIEVGQELIVAAGVAMKPYEAWNTPNSVALNSTQATWSLSEDALVEQTGLARIASAGGVLHPDAAVGTLLLITNLDNGRQCYAKVTGNFDATRDLILQVDENIKLSLAASGPLLRVQVRYALPDLSEQ